MTKLDQLVQADHDPLALEAITRSERLVGVLKALHAPVQGVLIVTSLGVLAGLWLGKTFWGFELLSHFQVQYFCISALCLLWFLCWRRWKLAIVAVGVCVVAGWQIAPYWFDHTHMTAVAPDLRVVSMNVNVGNRRYTAVQSFLRSVDADIIVVQEVSPAWADALQEISEYPHSLIQSRSDGFGIAILSKHELNNQEVFQAEGVPWLSVTIHHQHQNLTVIAVHTLPPVGARYSSVRNRQLTLLASVVKSTAAPVIVAGDFNSTPWSIYFKELINSTSLIDTRLGIGVRPSWPPRLVLGIPIDHVLASNQFEVCGLQIGKEIGSDHFPVICELKLTNP